MNIKNSITFNNPCYMNKKTITVTHLMLHSVGCAQPSAEVWFKKFNNKNASKAVHAVIDANTGDVWQFLPWNFRAWHCGSGSKGSGNSFAIGVEMGEPSAIKYTSGNNFTITDKSKSKAQVKTAYDSAVELFAFLCTSYKLDPLTAIISHNEGHKMGIASAHGDPEHLWKEFGLTMDGFRKDVKKAMDPVTEPTPTVTTGYKIRVTASSLNVRKSASAVSKKVATLKKGDVYTIIAEKNGWGQLKSKAGWISLKYTEKL